MGNLYNTIEELCKKSGINVTEMCRATGVSRGNLTDLKMGRQTGLSAKNADKIASYFGVSVGYLLGTEKSPAENKDITANDFQAAFWGGDENLTPEEKELLWRDVRDYAKFKMDQINQMKKNKK